MRAVRSEEHTSELQSHSDLVCRLLLEKKKTGTAARQANPRERGTLRMDGSDSPAVCAKYVIAKDAVTKLLAVRRSFELFFFFTDTATTEIYTLSLHDALPISSSPSKLTPPAGMGLPLVRSMVSWRSEEHTSELQSHSDLVCRLLLEKKKK